MLPSSLYILPTENLEEDEILEVVETAGWETAPGVGSTVLIVPEKEGQLLREIKWLYTVTAVHETGKRDWPWELEVEMKRVAKPCRWYDIVEEIQYQGLVPISGTHADGDRIAHLPTIQLIYEMLGEA
jgi:hypothetical protein